MAYGQAQAPAAPPVTPPRRPGPANLNQKDIYNAAAAARQAAAVYQVAGGFGALNLGGAGAGASMDLDTPPPSPTHK
jgi:hypothetical protein